jgi:hypothetical protein
VRDHVRDYRGSLNSKDLGKEAMCPDLVVTIAAMPAMPPAITHDEVAQQLITELLAAALDGPTEPAR